MKTIYLARHAKSSWNSDAETDFDRPLSPRGEVDAKRIGEEMKARDWLPQKVIASPAIRAKQTCKILCSELDYPIGSIQWNSEIYSAYTVTLLHILTNIDETTGSVMLLGHNPAMEDLLVHLCGFAETHQHKQANGKLFTTANVVKINADVTWKNLMMHHADLISMLRPKELDN